MKIYRRIATRTHLHFAVLLGLAACGAQEPQLKPQASAKIGEVKFPNFSRGYLLSSEGKTATNYEGSFLFWKPDIDFHKVSYVLGQGTEIKNADSAFKQAKFLDDPLYERGLAIEARTKAIDQELTAGSESTIAGFYASQSTALKESTQKWWAAHLDPSHRQQFHQHCAAMVWKMALSELIIKHYPFSALPTPSVLCTSYYEQEGYFSADACKKDPHATSQDYFSCFWGESGIGKTPRSFKKKLRDREENPSSEEILLAQKSLLAMAKGQKTLDLGEFYASSLVKRDENNKPLRDAQNNPYRIEVQIGTHMPTGIKPLAELSLASLASIGSSPLIDELMKDRRSRTGFGLSFHDRLFTYHLIDTAALPEDRRNLPELALLDQDLTNLQNLSTYPAEVFGGNLPDFASQHAGLIKEKKDLAAEKISLAEQRRQLQTALKLGAKQMSWMQKRSTVADYLLDQHLVEAMYPRILLKLSMEGSYAEVTLDFDYINRVRKARGCVDLTQQRAIACKGTASTEFVPLAVKFDRTSTLMELSLPLNEAASMGLTTKTSSTDKPSYQMWRSEDLRHRRMLVQLYPRAFDSVLSFLSGKVFIYEGSQEVAQGSATLTQYGSESFLR